MVNKDRRPVYLSCRFEGKKWHVHRLVAEFYIPNPDNLPCVNHKDGDKWNNSIDNLEWCTYSQNIQHAFDTGLNVANKGEKHQCARLTKEQVEEIRNIYVSGSREYGAKPLGRRFGVSNTHIRRILRHERWAEE